MLRKLMIAVVILALAISAGCIGDDDDVDDDERGRAIQAALAVYEEVVATGIDLTNGPCIAEELEDVPGWSVDIAHDPRQEIDNQPENQCQYYREGRTKHFVELDPEGNLIRAR